MNIASSRARRAVGSLAVTLAVVVLTAWAAGCGSKGGGCTPGASLSCACSDGSMGAQTCASDGTLGTCSCSSGSSSGPSGSTGSGTTDPCSTGADCSACTSAMTCDQCAQTAHSSGYQVYLTWWQCAVCSACRTVCGTTMCTNPPPSPPSACDSTTVDQAACGTCVFQCGESPDQMCGAQWEACDLNQDCVDYYNTIIACPKT